MTCAPLAWLGVGWHVIEAAIAFAAGVAAGSIALVGFGADSLVETFAGLIVVWRFADRRTESESAEQRAQGLIGLSFFLVAAYVAVEALRTLLAADHPSASLVGIGLAAVTLVTMPALASAKARVGERLGSSATKSEGRQNLLCAYLSAGLLVGLSANALFSWWWADPATALLIAGVAVNEVVKHGAARPAATSASGGPRQGMCLARLVGPQSLDDAQLRALDLVDLETDVGQVIQGLGQQMVGFEAVGQRLEQPLTAPDEPRRAADVLQHQQLAPGAQDAEGPRPRRVLCQGSCKSPGCR